ncbi:type III-A CRISPR-associated RAMP protein Csm4 [Aliarcobacter lanthieri]|uniref:type III-A CRISPR-associated RAMP protein Csm4 n=1 Tax=Aliarcobacter lanthieri TaxID=1355374 RepID=UPI003AABEED5
MKLLTIKIEPLSAFATLPKGDTIFGQMVFNDFLEGQKNFENYLLEEPKLIVSDMLPFGYVYKPTLPLDYFKDKNDVEVDKKDLRKKVFITIENLQNGSLHLCENVKYKQDTQVVKNAINRTSFTTGDGDFAPYSLIEQTYFKNLWIFILVDENLEKRAIELLKKVGKFGFGKKSTIGKGSFNIEVIQTPIKTFETNYYMSISPTILENQDLEDIWYEPFTRFGKFGVGKNSENIFKKPVLMANSASIIKTKKSISYFGKAVNNGTEQKISFLQGYSIAIPIKLKEKNV